MKIISCIKPANKAAVLLITLASLCLCSGCGRKKIDTGQWYDYGNGIINLNHVTHVSLCRFANTTRGAVINQELIDAKLEEWGDGQEARYFSAAIYFDDFQLALVDLEGYEKDEWEDKAQEALETYENLVERLNTFKD